MKFNLCLAALLSGLCAVAASPTRSELLDGLLGFVAHNVSEVDSRPDAHHPFIYPGLTDQRGPCPGLNAAANHGYINRSGIVTVAEVINGTGELFNMGPGLATFLSTISVAFTGNLETDTFSIGGEDARTYSATGVGSRAAGKQYGSDGHARIEGDMSPTRADFYRRHGDSHSGVGSRFARFVKLAKENDGQFNKTAANKLFAVNAADSLKNNPRVYADGWTFGISLAAYGLAANLFANGTVGYGGTNNYETISAILGYELNHDGKFCTTPERIPENWYRASAPYDLANGVFPNTGPTYNAYPFLNTTFGAIIADPARVGEFVCANIGSVIGSIPSALHGSSLERVETAIAYMQKRFLGPLLDPALGCNITIPEATATYGPETQPWFNDQLQEKGLGGGQKYGVCS